LTGRGKIKKARQGKYIVGDMPDEKLDEKMKIIGWNSGRETKDLLLCLAR
jgi:hypothetical protein